MSESSIEGTLFSIRPAVPSPIVDSGEPEIFLLNLFFTPDGDGNGPHVKLEGVSAHVAKVHVSLRLDGVEIETPIEVQPNAGDGRWSIQQQLPAASGLLAVQVRDDTDVAKESAIVHLPPYLAPVPVGNLLNLNDGVTKLLAGSSDRLIRTRSFSLIAHTTYSDLIPAIPKLEYDVKQITLISHETPARQIVTSARNLLPMLDDLTEKVRKEDVSQFKDEHVIRRMMFRRVDPPLRKIFQIDSISEGNRSLLTKFPFGGADYNPESETLTFVLPKLDMRSLPRAYSPTSKMIKASHRLFNVLKIWLFSQPSRLGICFAEFFRFRAAGLVRGEPFYSLAMDAGEEVQLEQTSETVHSETYEEVLERESEQSLTLSSTWSTDVSVAFDQSNTESSDWNVGSNAGLAGAPKIPLNIGVSGGLSAASAAQNSIGFTVKNAYELSRQAMARLRAQHKTRMEVQSQTSIGVSSVRSLNNRGAVRPRRVDFFKLYRKEMATYERHDARLCLKLLVDDPAHTVRDEFESNLDAVDPESEQHYSNLPSPPTSVTSTATFTWRPRQPLRIWPQGPSTTSIEQLEVDIKGSGSPTVPANFLLVRMPQVKMLKVTFSWIDNYFDDGDPLESYTDVDDGLVETSAGIKVVTQFSNIGVNSLKWLAAPTTNASDGKGFLRLEYINNFSLMTGATVSIHELVLEITSEWAPPSAEMTTLREQRDSIRQQIQNELTAERVLRIRNIAVADYQGSVLALAMQTHLSAGELTVQVNPHDFHEWFAIEDAYVENAPYWATSEGVERYNILRSRLSSLNLGVPLSDILVPELTASQAVLYLPIRPEAEKNALSLLPEYSEKDAYVQELVAEFREYRDDTFGPTPHASTLPSDVEISSPNALTGTLLGNADWETHWEPAQRKFQVLAHWADYVPTDGVDAQTVLSTTSKADEAVLRGVAEDTRYLG